MIDTEHLPGANVCFSAYGYGGTVDPRTGTRWARGITIGHGLEIISNEDEATNKRAFYAHNWSTHAFGVVCAFTSHQEYEEFSNWMKGYVDLAVQGSIGAMRVICLKRGFDKVGVLTTGITWGDQVGMIVWTVAYNFVGAMDTGEVNLPGYDPTNMVGNINGYNEYFYPSGTQLDASMAMEDQLYGWSSRTGGVGQNVITSTDSSRTGGVGQAVVPTRSA